jgi:RNA polymerase sigma-70 factor (ECF subfamily)
MSPRSRGSPPSTSATLIERATLGDREAWDEIVYLYSPLVDRWCRRWHLRDDVVQELGQDIFLKLFKNLGKFSNDAPNSGFRKWLSRLASNSVLDHLRGVERQPSCVGGSAAQWIVDNHVWESADTEPFEDGESTPPEERVILVRRCLELVRKEFEPRTFEAFWEIVLNGKAPGEVARSLGMKSVGAAYTAKSRVTKRLRELLEQLGEEMPPH